MPIPILMGIDQASPSLCPHSLSEPGAGEHHSGHAQGMGLHTGHGATHGGWAPRRHTRREIWVWSEAWGGKGFETDARVCVQDEKHREMVSNLQAR